MALSMLLYLMSTPRTRVKCCVHSWGEVVPIGQVVALPFLSELPVFDGPLGMRFWRMSNNEVFHQRLNIKSIGKATTQGKKFFRDMARNGMLPMMGISGRIQPSTWLRCAKPRCAVLCTCGRFRLSGQNDVVFVQQEVLWQGFRSGLAKSTLRRVRWSKSIDHSILYVTVPLVVAVPSQRTEGVQCSAETEITCSFAVTTSEAVADHWYAA